MRRAVVAAELLAAALLAAAPPLAAQSPVPFGPGVVFNYVMHNLNHPQDWQFFVTIVSVTPDETIYVEQHDIKGPDGKSRRAPWRRTVSRREAANSKWIDNGFSCYAADTNDVLHRGSVLRMASQRVFRQLKSAGEAEITMDINYSCSKQVTMTGTVRRVEPKPQTVSILLNGQRLDLQTLHFRGVLTNFYTQDLSDLWILDDSVRPWVIRQEGKVGKDSYLQQLGTVLAPDPKVEKALEQALEKSCRAPVYGIYFETASAELNDASRPTFQQIAAVMQRHPDWTLTIEGHTDSIGGAASNLDLSNRRSEAVRGELTAHYGIAAARLVTKGYGLTRPVESNGTIEGRARNRRVELVRGCK
jgi:outer membrane protein OmpA-like peptidoglycan-associated protein